MVKKNGEKFKEKILKFQCAKLFNNKRTKSPREVGKGWNSLLDESNLEHDPDFFFPAVFFWGGFYFCFHFASFS